jgi:hypothetical protein
MSCFYDSEALFIFIEVPHKLSSRFNRKRSDKARLDEHIIRRGPDPVHHNNFENIRQANDCQNHNNSDHDQQFKQRDPFSVLSVFVYHTSLQYFKLIAYPEKHRPGSCAIGKIFIFGDNFGKPVRLTTH